MDPLQTAKVTPSTVWIQVDPLQTAKVTPSTVWIQVGPLFSRAYLPLSSALNANITELTWLGFLYDGWRGTKYFHWYTNYVIPGDGEAQWVERRPQDPMDSMTRGLNPVRYTRKNWEVFRVKNIVAVGVLNLRVHTAHA